MTAEEETLTGRMARTVAAHAMLPDGAVVLVMVSGGGDSVALLRLLAEDAPSRGLRLSAFHLNHLLRSSDSDGDEAFVGELCTALDVPLHIVRYDVAAYAEELGLNLEDAGRQIRYRFAGEHVDALCDAAGVPRDQGRIAVAHTLDDRIETLLMRLAQGAGAGGLASLRPVRGRIVRPLADADRDSVREYLRELGQPWREDASNLDTTRTRARVRAELLPVLRDINPRADEAMARTLRVLADEDDLLGEMAEAFARDFAVQDEQEVRFERAMMHTLSVPMRRRVVRAAIAGAFPDATRMDFEHVEAVVLGMDDDGFARDLTDGLRAFSEYDKMVISRGENAFPPLAPCLLPVPHELDLGAAGIIRSEAADPVDATGSARSVTIDEGCIEIGLVVDGPRRGDRMRPIGMSGTKKLSDLLVDEKVPRRRRGITPVVRDGDRIVWVAGVRMSDDYKLTRDTTKAVRLEWIPAEETQEA